MKDNYLKKPFVEWTENDHKKFCKRIRTEAAKEPYFITIELYYGEIKLGELEKIGDDFVYNSNIDGENRIKELDTYFIHNQQYVSMWNSKDNKSKVLFKPFENIAKLNRKDLIESAKIKPTDDAWRRLVKFAGLKWNKAEFTVTLKGL